MPSDELKKRIEALNRRPLRHIPIEEPKPTRAKTKKNNVPVAVDPFDFQEKSEFGIITQAVEGPGYCLIEKPASDLEALADTICNRFIQLTGHPDGKAVDRLALACKSDRIAPKDVLFLDLETTGLSSTPVFLIGTMECIDKKFVFRQYFARTYAEELSILSAISERMKTIKLVVTFNGKTFDMPFLKNRAIANRTKLIAPELHLDLLYEARRLYRGELPNCKLQTLERYICNRQREDDIPGSEIPAAYHEFVRTGNTAKIELILLHNLYDILTMADLMHRMWCRC